MKTTKLPLLRTADREVVFIGEILFVYARVGSLRIRTWFGVVKNLVVDVLLGQSFIDHCIWGIFSTREQPSRGILNQWRLYCHRHQSKREPPTPKWSP